MTKFNTVHTYMHTFTFNISPCKSDLGYIAAGADFCHTPLTCWLLPHIKELQIIDIHVRIKMFLVYTCTYTMAVAMSHECLSMRPRDQTTKNGRIHGHASTLPNRALQFVDLASSSIIHHPHNTTTLILYSVHVELAAHFANTFRYTWMYAIDYSHRLQPRSLVQYLAMSYYIQRC